MAETIGNRQLGEILALVVLHRAPFRGLATKVFDSRIRIQ